MEDLCDFLFRSRIRNPNCPTSFPVGIMEASMTAEVGRNGPKPEPSKFGPGRREPIEGQVREQGRVFPVSRHVPNGGENSRKSLISTSRNFHAHDLGLYAKIERPLTEVSVHRLVQCCQISRFCKILILVNSRTTKDNLACRVCFGSLPS